MFVGVSFVGIFIFKHLCASSLLDWVRVTGLPAFWEEAATLACQMFVCIDEEDGIWVLIESLPQRRNRIGTVRHTLPRGLKSILSDPNPRLLQRGSTYSVGYQPINESLRATMKSTKRNARVKTPGDLRDVNNTTGALEQKGRPPVETPWGRNRRLCSPSLFCLDDELIL